ncbi:MAG: hypothetical protein JW957_03605 [Candidatus Omnitrophica bacterium]|nr:hypothetical protein [Candidatus Omnitrophota bacterium]
MDWPAVSVSTGGKKISPTVPLDKPAVSKNRISQSFEENGLLFTVAITLSKNSWFIKNVSVSSGKKLPTPDFAEVDRQVIPPDDMRSCGYIPTTLSESDMAATMPGCGYPLIGKHFFTGLEHPAGFNRLSSNKEEFRLVHHPVWNGNKLQEVSAVFGWGENARETFDEYLDSIRLPLLKKPLFIFCTFWSDPRDNENMYSYLTSYEVYEMYFKAFFSLGLKPDLFTLDAGWQDRMSIFKAKKEVGGDAGLIKLRKLAEKNKSGLSLWVSHNGPMGIATEYMKKQGFETGAGNSSTYSGDGFGVMMDGRFSKAVEKRFCELVRRVKVKHLKIDWDNDCATNEKFNEIYPTRNHVRQATLNVFFRIAAELRKINPAIVTRNGWWPSPWWMPHASHIHLSDSGDSEFSSLPGRTQRAASTTHRDLMYYNIFQRDKTPLPLDCLDNFKFPNALQNPYPEDPASWVNTAWMHCMRGSTQIAYTLTPEALEDWQAESLKQVMEFCRTYAKHIFVPHGRMILGHPGRGEVYGFLQPGKEESWCILRNPLPVPQTVKFNPSDIEIHRVKSTEQFYPCYETLKPEKGITFLANEIKIVIFFSVKRKKPYSLPYMVKKKGKDFLSYFPASATVTKSVQPMVHPLQRINSMKCAAAEKKKLPNGVQYMWRLEIPYKMKDSELQFCIKAKEKSDIKVRAVISRSMDGTSEYLLPVTAISAGIPGYGEKRNMDFPINKGERYFSARIPYGGQFGIWLTLEGVSETGTEISAWVAGYEDLSRNAVACKKCPVRFSQCLPFQHPVGFGKALKLPLSGIRKRNVEIL